ncbi:hypothetical protein FACS189493_7820 [Spirochaetia bacterium]|nr:hypothetical protein FACS189493_7820 [Spirochaetia bacterium]
MSGVKAFVDTNVIGYQYSYYDSLIVASALEQDCDYLLSEDMNDGQVIGKMAIKNIFKMP